jgi:hypothetical protein
MTLCSCGSPLQETYYSPAGDALCRLCYYAEQTRAQDARATASLAAEAPPGFKLAGTKPEEPGSAVRNGFLLLGACVASTLATGLLVDRVYLASGLLGVFALAAFARGLALARQAGSSKVGITAGIVLSFVVLFALVVITIL